MRCPLQAVVTASTNFVLRRLNLCKPVVSTAFAACHGKPEAAVYQIERGETPSCFALGAAKELEWGLSEPGNPSKGVTLTYSGGEMCHKRIEKQVEKVVEPPAPPPPECKAKTADGQEQAMEKASASCPSHATEDDCTADVACTYVVPPPPLPPPPGEKPATYTETVVEWVDVPRSVVINMTCDMATQREDMASIVRMASTVVAAEPEMCTYVVPTLGDSTYCFALFLIQKMQIDCDIPYL